MSNLSFSAGSRYPLLHARKRISFVQSLAHRPLLLTFLGGTVVMPIAFVAYALDEVPLTGRWRLNVIPYELDVALGHHVYQDFMASNADIILPSNHEACRAVRELGDQIVAASGIPELQNLSWDYTVAISDEVNAMVLMGGNVIVYSGMLELAGSAEKLAVVMSHEIAHVLARHSAEQLTNNSTLVALNMLLSSVFGYGLPYFASELLFFLPNSRKNESEADFIGLLLLARLGVDPRTAPELWRAMAEKDGEANELLSFVSTHPSHGMRIAQLESWMPLAMEEFKVCHGHYPEGYDPPQAEWGPLQVEAPAT